MKIVQSFAVT